MKLDQKRLLFSLIAIAGLGILFFWEMLSPGAIRFCTDENIGHLSMSKSFLPRAFIGHWMDFVIVGAQEMLSTNMTTFLRWLLPVRFLNNWSHALYLGLSSFFLILYLRRCGLHWSSCFLGVLAAFWLASNFTFVYAGHTGKFLILMFSAAFLWLTAAAAENGKLSLSLLAGGALGATFIEQPDVAFFTALVLVPYAVFEGWRNCGKRPASWARFLLPLFIVALFLAVPALWSGYKTAVRDVAALEEESPADRWDYITQWSWPPEESIDFIAPGYFGWRSGEPEGPYWGRMGRSADWERTGQGLQNYKVENQYIGAIPLILAFLALFAALSGGSRAAFMGLSGSRRQYVIFWGAAAGVTLLLSFGKYFPLYSLFFRLPLVSTVRNPNKFLQMFQLAVAILAAYGFDLTIRGASSGNGRQAGAAKKERQSSRPGSVSPLGREEGAPAHALLFVRAVLGLAGLLFIWSLLSIFSTDEQVGRLIADGWGRFSSVIVRNRNRALVHAFFMTLAAAVFIRLVLWNKIKNVRIRNAFLCAVIVLVAGDAFLLSRHYVKTMPPSYIEENNVIRILKNELEHNRVALVAQDHFYRTLLTYTFPYHGIRSINIVQLPRVSQDYINFMKVLDRNSIRLWQLCAVSHILAPTPMLQKIQSDPELKDSFDLIHAFSIIPGDDDGISIIPGTKNHPGEHVILRSKLPAPRYSLIAGWKVLDDESALENLADDDFRLFSKVILAPESAEGLPSSTGEGDTGGVSVVEYQSGRVVLNVSTEHPAILRAADRYDEDWKAVINGQPAPVRRVDYLFQGVFVEPGVHEIVLTYSPHRWPLYVQALGVLACVAAIISLLSRRRRARIG